MLCYYLDEQAATLAAFGEGKQISKRGFASENLRSDGRSYFVQRHFVELSADRGRSYKAYALFAYALIREFLEGARTPTG